LPLGQDGLRIEFAKKLDQEEPLPASTASPRSQACRRDSAR
jgi:hypothetical protein